MLAEGVVEVQLPLDAFEHFLLLGVVPRVNIFSGSRRPRALLVLAHAAQLWRVLPRIQLRARSAITAFFIIINLFHRINIFRRHPDYGCHAIAFGSLPFVDFDLFQ